jgi:superfamily II DNA or RNA helicase
MSDVIIEKKNEVHIKLHCDPHILYELQQYFTFEVESAKFMSQYRSRHWDGKIRLLSTHTGEIYVGLLDKVIDKLKIHNYTYEFKENKFYGLPFEINEEVSFEGVNDYMNSICSHTPRKYQVEGVYDALRYNRKLLISPTASGKSMMIYSIVRYHLDKNRKILLVVPTTSLVEQMYKDFQDYGWDAESYCHRIYSGKEKTNEHPVTITTWQSVYKLERSFFEDYDVVIGDEAHLFKSKSLIDIMTKLHHAKYRFGFTGTLDGTQTHKWVLEGLFGPSYKVTRTYELMEQGHISQLDIQCLVLKHPPHKFET